jgi:type I restriction enzyme S subunit
MNAEDLLKHYARISEASDAIPKLRRLVLDLAVRGKLVEQDAKDEPAAELLTRIVAKGAVVDTKRRKSRDTSASNKLEEEPFSLPASWEFVPLAKLIRVLNGRAYKKQELLDAGTPVLRVGNLFTSNHWYYSDLELDEDKYCNAGDLIFAWSASFGPFIWDGPKVIFHYHIWKLPLISEEDLSKQYLYTFLLQKTREIKEAGHGMSMVHMTKEKMEKLLVPLPPLAEQHRIVAKVDELMALCDRLEEARTVREAVRDRLTAASLARLTAPETTKENFQSHARFALQTLPALTTRPDQVKPLRQTILNLAVRGKLVAQSTADEPAAELLKRIVAESNRSAKSGARRSNEEDNSVFPFDCPKGWVWTVVQQILDPEREISYGVIKLGAEPKSGGVPTLRCSDVRPGFIDLSGVRKVNETIEAEYARTRLYGGEVLINIRGTLGGVALVSEKLKGFNVAREVAVVPIAKEIVPQFVVYLMLSPYFWDHIQGSLRGIAYKGLNLGILRNLPIPLPPLAEQKRIVDKVDALMALCDQLEASLTTTATTRQRLLTALLHEALEPAADELEAAE